MLRELKNTLSAPRPRDPTETETELCLSVSERSYPSSGVRSSSLREQPRRATHVRGQGRRPGGATPQWNPRAAAGRSNLTPEARGGGQEDQPHVQGAVAAQAQEGLEELSHVEGQEGRW